MFNCVICYQLSVISLGSRLRGKDKVVVGCLFSRKGLRQAQTDIGVFNCVFGCLLSVIGLGSCLRGKDKVVVGCLF